MRNGYDHHHHPIHDNHKKIYYMPIFCRLSIKDVKLSNHYRDPISSSAAAAAEPSSPKVSCIGQVKRNNRVVGFPSAAAADNHHKPIKLNKLFSSKTLLPNTAAAAKGGGGGRSGSRSCRTTTGVINNYNSRRPRLKSGYDHNCDQDCVRMLDVGEMDPPLPVVKRAAPPPGVGRDEVNIWKRRFKGVEIEQIHLPSNKFEAPPSTV